MGGGSGKIDSSLTDTGGHILLVPNFTLYSRNQKGSGIDYTQSA
ncbi:MAG: D-aminoacyl-tRNA deacylase [Candidatus Peribacteria bacterium]|nr:MAG: D-aminoacyl-tRNA deacylase [Candidatus Peribacteria bacterium]